jgi:hypothetical protein
MNVRHGFVFSIVGIGSAAYTYVKDQEKKRASAIAAAVGTGAEAQLGDFPTLFSMGTVHRILASEFWQAWAVECSSCDCRS